MPLLGADVAAVDRTDLTARAGIPAAAIDRLIRRYGNRKLYDVAEAVVESHLLLVRRERPSANPS